jgi:membrane protein implicated in regulation of membrane protease activity
VTDPDLDVDTARIPTSSLVMVGAAMVFVLSLGMVVSFSAPLAWWILPVASALLVIVLADRRLRRRRRRLAADADRAPVRR